jgi:hypothetical protein
MKYLTAWQAYSGSVTRWLRGLLESGEIDLNSTVWGGADGSYAVGDDYDPEEFEQNTEYTDSGNVSKWVE